MKTGRGKIRKRHIGDIFFWIKGNWGGGWDDRGGGAEKRKIRTPVNLGSICSLMGKSSTGEEGKGREEKPAPYLIHHH